MLSIFSNSSSRPASPVCNASGRKRSRNSASLSASKSSRGGTAESSGDGRGTLPSAFSSFVPSSSSSNYPSFGAPRESGVSVDAIRARRDLLMQGPPPGLWTTYSTSPAEGRQEAEGMQHQEHVPSLRPEVNLADGAPLNTLSNTHPAHLSTITSSFAPLPNLTSSPLTANTNAKWAASPRDRVLSLAQLLLNTTPFIGNYFSEVTLFVPVP